MIAGSLHVQRRMFLRIGNKPAMPWKIRDFSNGSDPLEWHFVRAEATDNNPRDSAIPVALNPCLEHLDTSKRGVWRVFNGGERLGLNNCKRLTLQQVKQQSYRGFLSGPHCRTVYIKLCFKLGVRLPTIINVESTVTGDTPLTISAVITRVLDTPGRTAVA
jgi:hypothetical protein